VLLPALLADNDLAFGEIGPAGLRPGRRGTTEPVGETSRESLAHADLVVVPALGVDPAGFRLGRGGGSYDRALRRAGPGALLVALLREGEVGPGPAPEPHDVAIHAAVLPGGIRWLNDPPVVARL
jgi:5-formyltetrahydrofolate cyclo-ligase